MAVLSGRYTITATIDGAEYSQVVDIDAAKTLDRITAISEDTLTSTEMQLSWHPVAGAASYFVEIEDATLPQGFRGLYTSSSSASFAGMSFQEGEEYIERRDPTGVA